MSYSILLKSSQYQQSSTWERIQLKKLEKRLRKTSPELFERGDHAVYLHSRIQISAKAKDFTFLANLDVESKDEHHSSIQANIEAAREVLRFLYEKGLVESLSIFCTGSGFRFAWPYGVPKKYKRAFLKFIQSVEGIDPGPQKNNSFLRVLGYRGNSKQGRPIKDVHIHKLPSIDDLWELDEAAYLALVKGRPDFNESMSWLQDVIPTSEIPAAWTTFLEEWKTYTDLQSTIWSPDNTAAEAKYIDSMVMQHLIESHLEAQGITHIKKRTGNMQILRLSVCPICDRRGCAYVTSKGRLKCWHANSCDAGKRATDGGILGLKPHEWIPGYQEAYEEQRPSSKGNCHYETVQQIRDRIEVKSQDRFTDQIYCIDPGVGKTHGLLESIVPKCEHQNKLYLVPRHKLAWEIAKKAKKFRAGKNIKIYELYGRNEKNCTHFDVVEKLQKRGFSPGMMICVKCQQDNEGPCRYYKQFELLNDVGFGIAAHHVAAYNDLSETLVDTLVVDEDSINAFIRSDEVSIDDMWTLAPGYLGVFFDRIRKALKKVYRISLAENPNTRAHNRVYINEPPKGSRWEGSKTLWELAGITQEELERLSVHLGAYQRRELEGTSTWLWRLYDDEYFSFPALKWLLCALGEEYPGTPYVKINLRAEGIADKLIFRFVRVYKNTPQFPRHHESVPNIIRQMIVLDGTGSKKEADALFGRDFELIEGRVKLTCQKTFIRRGLGKVKSLRLQRRPGELKKLAREAVKHLRPQDQKVLIATHMMIKKQMLPVFQELLPGRMVKAVHFYGNRGVNDFENFDAIICFGSPGTNRELRLDEAMELFPDEADREEWFEQKATAELIQTIHRIRPIHENENGKKNIILVASKWPSELGRISYEIDSRKGSDKIHHSTEKAYQRIQRFYKVHGFCTLETLYALGIGPLSRKELIQKVAVLSYRHLYKYIFIGDVTLKLGSSEIDLILFKRKNTASDLILKLQEDFVGQAYEVKIHSQWTRAYGSIQAAKDFYRMMGATFKPENWRKIDK